MTGALQQNPFVRCPAWSWVKETHKIADVGYLGKEICGQAGIAYARC